MKVIFLLLLLIGLLNSSIIRLKYHKCTDKIYSGKGLVALELQEFDTDDSIYITYSAYDGNIHNYVKYIYTDEFPVDNDMYLPNNKDPYTSGTTSHKHNVSDGHGGWRVYYTYDHHYYYEFKKPENMTYLVMHYNLAGYTNKYIDIDNTYLGRYLTIIIICSVIGGIILIGVGIFFFVKYRDRIRRSICDCDCDFDCLSCLCDCSCPCPWRHSYSYDISSSPSVNNTLAKKDNLLIDTSTNSSNSAPKDLEIKNPVPEEDYGEKPYFEQDNQPKDNYNSAENNQVPPPNYYAQPEAGYNPNDPLSQNNEGYNSGNYTGGGGIYQ